MIKRLLCVTLALGSSLELLLAADAFTGSWKLDVAKSTFASNNPAPLALRPNAGQLTCVVQDHGFRRQEAVTLS